MSRNSKNLSITPENQPNKNEPAPKGHTLGSGTATRAEPNGSFTASLTGAVTAPHSPSSTNRGPTGPAAAPSVGARKRGHAIGWLSFRAKMFLLFTAAVAAAAGLFGWGATYYARQAFSRITAQRSDALVAQFRNEYLQRGNEVVQSVESIAEADRAIGRSTL